MCMFSMVHKFSRNPSCLEHINFLSLLRPKHLHEKLHIMDLLVMKVFPNQRTHICTVLLKAPLFPLLCALVSPASRSASQVPLRKAMSERAPPALTQMRAQMKRINVDMIWSL